MDEEWFEELTQEEQEEVEKIKMLSDLGYISKVEAVLRLYEIVTGSKINCSQIKHSGL